MTEKPLRHRRRGHELRSARLVGDLFPPGVLQGLDGLRGSVLTPFDPDGFVIVDGVATCASAGSAGLLPGDPVELCYDGAPTRRLFAYRPGEGPRESEAGVAGRDAM